MFNPSYAIPLSSKYLRAQDRGHSDLLSPFAVLFRVVRVDIPEWPTAGSFVGPSTLAQVFCRSREHDDPDAHTRKNPVPNQPQYWAGGVCLCLAQAAGESCVIDIDVHKR